MKKFNIFFLIILAILALVFTLTISEIVPKDKFNPYVIELDSLWEKKSSQQEYLIDITGDGKIETIRHHNINIPGHSIEFQQGEKIQQVYIFFEYGETFIGKYLKFADINNDSRKEMLFMSVREDTAFLNIFSYNQTTKELLRTEEIKIGFVGEFNGKIDVVNNFIVTDNSVIYFDLQGLYAVQPRHIYKYDFKNKKLFKNRINSLVIPNVHFFNYQNHNYLLASYVRATGNTISTKEAEMLRTSPDKDTVAMYEKYKHLEYEYGDFASYLMLYDDSLRFAFEPIVFDAWTNFTKAILVFMNNEPRIVAFTNAQMDDFIHEKFKLVTVCNLQGEIIKQIPLPHNYTEIFAVDNKIIFYGEKTLFITDDSLDQINELKNINYAQGFVDINNDNKPEFVAFKNNVLIIYSKNFEVNATFKIEQEFAPYPEDYSFTTLYTDTKNLFVFNTRLFYYKFSYKKNNIAFLKYPFFISIFFVAFGILFFIFRLNSKRLEKENLKLEQIVKERTKEIASQKEEIQLQAKDLKIKNISLIELSKFKKLMTDTVIHDLKNPLNYIIGATNDKTIRQSGYNMLNIVLNILDINKAQATKLSVNLRSLNVAGLIENAISRVEFLAEQRNLSFDKIIKKNFMIKADKDLLIRTMVNLLTNAIKYSPLNSKVTIQVQEYNHTVQIDVIDYGKGILPENIGTLFNEYTQIEAKNSGDIKSTGIGLTFCKIATEAQNAKIDVYSVPGEKTCFSLIFPLISTSNKEIEMKEDAQNEGFLTEEERKKNYHILFELKGLEIYRASEILNLLNTIENSSENVGRLKQKIKNAIYTSNTAQYKKLIENEL